MPPKAKEKATKGKPSNEGKDAPSGGGKSSFKISAVIKIHNKAESFATPLSLRVCSEWMDSLQSALPVGVFSYSETAHFKPDRKSMNESPGVFVYAFDRNNTPIGFAYLDSSALFLSGGTVCAKAYTFSPDLEVECTLSSTSQLLPDTMTTEPLTLFVKKLKNFPTLKEETSYEIMQSTFLAGHIRLGDLNRLIFFSVKETPDESSVSPLDLAIISTAIVLLEESPFLREEISSSQHTLHLFSSKMFDGVLQPLSMKKLTSHLLNKRLPEADKLLMQSFYQCLERLTSTALRGSCCFRTTALLSEKFDCLESFVNFRESKSEQSSHIIAKVLRSHIINVSVLYRPLRLIGLTAVAGNLHPSTMSSAVVSP